MMQGNKRRGNDYDRDFDARKAVEMTIFHLGDKHPTMTVEEDVSNTTSMILAEIKNMSSEISSSLVACLLELPHKTNVYCDLLVAVSKSDSKFVISTVERLFSSFAYSLEAGNWKHLVQGLRVFSELAASSVFSKASFLEFLSQAATFAVTNDIDFDKSHCIVWSLLATLSYASKVGKDEPEFFLVWDQLSGWVKSQQTPSKDLIALLSINNDFASNNWNIWPQANNVSDLNTTLESVDWSKTSIEASWNPNHTHCKIFEDTFDASLTNAKFVQWQVTLDLRQLGENFELNHRKMAELLLNGAPENIGHPEKIVCEFLFGELLEARSNGLSPICYQVVLMNCCRLASLFPPIMAKSVFALVNRLDEFGIVKAGRLASWLALHLSNFDFKWKWTEWEDVPSLPQSSLKSIFVRMVLEKLVRLSYYDRIAEVVPEWAKAMLPPTPDPIFKFSSDETSQRIVTAFQERTPYDRVAEMLKEKPLEEAKDLFIQSLLMAGSKTLSHAVILIERYLPLLQELHPKEDLEAKLGTIQSIAQFWSNSLQHFQFILERLVHYRVISAPSVIEWSLRTSEAKFSSGESLGQVIFGPLSYELISATLVQAQNFPLIVKQKMGETDDMERLNKLEISLKGVESEWQQSLDLTLQGLAALPSKTFASEEDRRATAVACESMHHSISNSFRIPM